MQEYGPLAQLVAIAGNLGAASFALYTAWAGRSFWEPQVENFEKAPRRVTGVICIVGIAILFFHARRSFEFSTFAILAGALSVAAMILFLADLFLRKVAIFKCEGQNLGVVGGLWLTNYAKEVLSGHSPHLLPGQSPPSSLHDLFCNSGRQPDRIWSRSSQAAALVLITGTYCVWTGSATLAVSTAALMLEQAIR